MAELLVDPDQLAGALNAAAQAGAQWAEIFVERRMTETVRLGGGVVAEVRSDIDLGAGVRVLGKAGHYGFASTNVLTTESLLETSRAACIASGASGHDVGSVRVDLRQAQVTPCQWADSPGHETGATVKVDVLRAIDAAAHEEGAAVRQVVGTHVDVTQEVFVANTTGSLVQDRRVRTRITCRVSARRDGRQSTGFAGPGVGAGMELYDLHPPEAVGGRAANRALRALEGDDPPTGEMPVVLGPAGGGLLLHEACGHGLEGDGLARNSSAFAATRGHRVGSKLVTAVDDPSIAQAYGSYGIDDAGTPARPTVLLDAGVQVGAMTDAATAEPLGDELTANARRASYAHSPLTRMSNTYVAAGEEEPAEIIGDVAHGVYVVTLRGGDVDITSGDFAFTASEAFLVEKGEVTSPLAGLVLLGNGPAVLASVVAVGNDLAMAQALCGKEEQSVPVSYGSPTLLVTGLTVSGGRGG